MKRYQLKNGYIDDKEGDLFYFCKEGFLYLGTSLEEAWLTMQYNNIDEPNFFMVESSRKNDSNTHAFFSEAEARKCFEEYKAMWNKLTSEYGHFSFYLSLENCTSNENEKISEWVD